MYKLTITQPMETASGLHERVRFTSDRLGQIMGLIELLCDTWHDIHTTFTIEEVQVDAEGEAAE